MHSTTHENKCLKDLIGHLRTIADGCGGFLVCWLNQPVEMGRSAKGNVCLTGGERLAQPQSRGQASPSPQVFEAMF